MAEIGEAARRGVGVREAGGIMSRLGTMALELGLLAAVWWILGLKPPLVGALAAVIVVPNLVPERVGTLALGVMLLGLGGFFVWYYSAEQLAMVVGLFGVVAVVAGVLSLRRGEGRG